MNLKPDFGQPAPVVGSSALSTFKPPSPSTLRQAPWLRYVLNHPYTCISALALVAMWICATLKHSSEWDGVYLRSARVLLNGNDIYRDLFGYTYPPFSAWLMIPFTLLPITAARAIWFVLCAASLLYLIISSWQLAGGPRIERQGNAPAASRREQLAFLVGHACALQLALNGLTHLQTDLLIAALLMAGCRAIVENRFYRAALLIGLGAAFKATPLLFAPYLILRGKWAAAVLLIGVCIGA